mgnify:CR=1 FL=1
MSGNGIHDSLDSTTGKLTKLLAEDGYVAVDYIYPPTNSITALLRNKKDVLGFQNMLVDGSTIIAHSRFCRVVLKMLQKNTFETEIDDIYLIAPATKRAWNIPFTAFKKIRGDIIVIYNPHDLAILAGAMALFHPFGTAGRSGLKETHPKIKNYRWPSFEGKYNHSFFFNDDNIQDLKEFITGN